MFIKRKIEFSIFVLLLFTVILFTSCTETKLQRVIVKAKPAFNILPYNEILISNFKVISSIKRNIIEEEMVKTLKEEISIYFKKSVKKGIPINPSNKEIFSNPFFWREYTKKDKTAIITGIIKLKKETRSQIETVRSTPLSLKSKNVLKTLKLISSKITFYIFDGDTGKKVYQYTFGYKISDESGEADSVLVSRVISIGVDRFINRIVPREHIVYRYFFNY